MPPVIGFIGLGNMGRPMAANLLKAGYPVRVWDRTPARAAALAAQGATSVSRPEGVAEAGALVISSLSDDRVLEEVVGANRELLCRLGHGGVHVSTSTVAPETARRLAEGHQPYGVAYLAAPVLGRPDAAAAARLWVFLSGPALSRTSPPSATRPGPLARNRPGRSRLSHNGTGAPEKVIRHEQREGRPMSDGLMWHRIQFAFTITYHDLFPQLTMGLLSTNAQPGWRDARWLGGYLTNSALLLGCAEMLVLAAFLGQERATALLRPALMLLLVLNLVPLGLMVRNLLPALSRAYTPGQLGRLAALGVGVGSLLPVALLLAGSGRLIVLAAVLFLLLGSLAVRFVIVRLPHTPLRKAGR
jgi:hypothetical protein